MFVKKYCTPFLCLVIVMCFFATSATGWHDETHLAVAKAAGYYKWYNAVGADMAKIKAGSIERYNHYFDNPKNVAVTPQLVLDQIDKYNDKYDKVGHLYGAIIASLRAYRSIKQTGKYAEYHLAFCAHYVTDLSQPLHNTPYDGFNRSRHAVHDGIVEDEVLANIQRIEKHMKPISLRAASFEEDLAQEIANIANSARELGLKLRKENRNITKQEAYVQLGQSASLFRAFVSHATKRLYQFGLENAKDIVKRVATIVL